MPILEEGEKLLAINVHEALEIRVFQTTASKTAEANKKAKKTMQEMVPEEYREYLDVFAKESFDEMPPRRPWDHVIELLPDMKPLDCKIYPLSPSEQVELDKFLNKNLKSGCIQLSKSQMASPFFFIKKKDGSLRPVHDY